MTPRTALAAILASTAAAAAPALVPPDCAGLGKDACAEAMQVYRDKLDAPQMPAGWSYDCRQDRVTLGRLCTLFKAPKLRVTYTEELGYCFSGPLNDHPGKTAIIRIGDNAPVAYEQTLACGEVGATIIDQMRSEQPGAARGWTWPSGRDEFEFDLTGFSRAFAEFQKIAEAQR